MTLRFLKTSSMNPAITTSQSHASSNPLTEGADWPGLRYLSSSGCGLRNWIPAVILTLFLLPGHSWADYTPPPTAVLKDLVSNRSESDQTDSDEGTKTLVCSKDENGKVDLEIKLEGGPSGTYDWVIKKGSQEIAKATATENAGERLKSANSFTVTKSDLTIAPELHTLEVTKSGGFKRKINLLPIEFERDEDVADGNWQAMTGQLAKALPGQKINLRIKTSNLPAGVTLTDYEWVLPNKVFKDYEADQTHAKLTQMAAGDRDDSEVSFYFTDSGSKDIKVKCKVNGTASEFTTTLNVEKPTTSFTTKLGATAFNAGPTKLGLFAAGGSAQGIDYTGKVTVPTGWPQGQWHWVQVVTPGRTKVDTSGATKPWSLNGQQVLDTTYPYEPAPYGSHPGTTGGYATNSQHTDYDAPATTLPGWTSVTVSDSFQMFIMFLPDGQDSRYVPTQSVTWTWGGAAQLSNGSWSLTAPTQSASPASENSTHPTWTNNVKNGSF